MKFLDVCFISFSPYFVAVISMTQPDGLIPFYLILGATMTHKIGRESLHGTIVRKRRRSRPVMLLIPSIVTFHAKAYITHPPIKVRLDATNSNKVYTAEDLLKGLKRSGIDISLKDAVNLLSQITGEK